MTIKIKPNSFFIFDLDDTLYPEIDYLKSAFHAIANQLSAYVKKDIYQEMISSYFNKKNVFEWIVNEYRSQYPGLSVESLLKQYREHQPDITMYPDALNFIKYVRMLNIQMGLITDGRSITQRNKLKALDIEFFFQDIIISEEFGSTKPDERNYRYFERKYPGYNFWYVGDNTDKDFIVPSKLGWSMICRLDDGSHIHKDKKLNLEKVSNLLTINNFDDLKLIS